MQGKYYDTHFAGEEIKAIFKTDSLNQPRSSSSQVSQIQDCFDQVAKWSDK